MLVRLGLLSTAPIQTIPNEIVNALSAEHEELHNGHSHHIEHWVECLRHVSLRIGRCNVVKQMSGQADQSVVNTCVPFHPLSLKGVFSTLVPDLQSGAAGIPTCSTSSR